MTPFRFHPIYQPRIWGGRKLQLMLGRTTPVFSEPCGESWEISDRPGAVSIVKEGPWQGYSLNQLWQEHRKEIFGDGYDHFTNFPLLCKLLDVSDKLSIQVHPPKATATRWGGEEKNEIWYILYSSSDATIYAGLQPNTTPDDLHQAILEDDVDKHLRSHHLDRGKHLYIPSGLIHAISGEHLIVEIQQNSDTTYRLYDWNRRDSLGRGRELHVPQSLDAIKEYQQLEKQPGYTTQVKPFSIKEHILPPCESFTQSNSKKFAIFAILEGRISWPNATATQGDFIISPAHATPITTETKTHLLEINVP